MTETGSQEQTRVAKIGWRLLMLVSGVYLLNGIAWFFSGPGQLWRTLPKDLEPQRPLWRALFQTYSLQRAERQDGLPSTWPPSAL